MSSGCPYSELANGPITQRLATRERVLQLLGMFQKRVALNINQFCPSQREQFIAVTMVVSSTSASYSVL